MGLMTEQELREQTMDVKVPVESAELAQHIRSQLKLDIMDMSKGN